MIGGWNVTASNSTAAAQATRAARNGRQHVIYGVSASYGSTTAIAPKLIKIVDGSTTTLWQTTITESYAVTFPAGLAVKQGLSITAEAANSTAGAAYINLHGVTR